MDLLVVDNAFRLGISRRLVSTTDRKLQGCLHLYSTAVLAATGRRRKMACGIGACSLSAMRSDQKRLLKTHEVIGSPPNVSVPTHFAKVVLATRPVSPSNPDTLEVSTGAFVLPNAIIPDEAPLESFVMPGSSCSVIEVLCTPLISGHWM